MATSGTSSDTILSEAFASGSELYNSFIIGKKLVIDAPIYGYGSSDPLVSGPFAVFITMPDLNVADAGVQAYLSSAAPFADKAVYNAFSSSTTGTNFIKILTNAAKNAPFMDINLDTIEHGANWDGAKITVAKSSLNSRQSSTISIQFSEYANAQITNIINFWVNYIDAVQKGLISPKVSNHKDRKIDYVCSIYVFALKPDYETITHAAKYTGAFPTSVPASSGSTDVGSAEIKIVDVSWAFSKYEFNTAAVLEDFNLSSAGGNISSPIAQVGNIGGRGTLKGHQAYLIKSATKPMVSMSPSTSSVTS